MIDFSIDQVPFDVIAAQQILAEQLWQQGMAAQPQEASGAAAPQGGGE